MAANSIGEIDRLVRRAERRTSSHDARKQLEAAIHTITKRPELDQAPAGYMLMFRASDK